MTAVSQVQYASAQYTGVYVDQMSGAAKKSSDALDELGLKVEVTDTKVAKSLGNWSKMAESAANATTVARQLSRAEIELGNAINLQDAAMAKYGTTSEAITSVITGLQSKVDGLRSRYENLFQLLGAGATQTELHAAAIAKVSSALTAGSSLWQSYVDKAAGASGVARQLAEAETELSGAVRARADAIKRGETTIEASVGTVARLTDVVDSLKDSYNSMIAVAEKAASSNRFRDYLVAERAEFEASFIAQQKSRDQMIATAKATQEATTAQAAFNEVLGVQPRSNSITSDSYQPSKITEANSLLRQQAEAEDEAATGALKLRDALIAERAATEANFLSMEKRRAEMISTARAAQDAATAQASFNQILGVKSGSNSITSDSLQTAKISEATSEFKRLADAEREAAAATDLLATKRNQFLATVDPAAAHEENLNKVLAFGDELYAKKQITLAQYNKALNVHSENLGQARFAQQQLYVQTTQFFSSLQSGTPILLAFIQQGHQLVDVAFATGTGFAVLGKAITNAFSSIWAAIISPIGGVVIAIGVIITALGVLAFKAESAAQRLNDLKNTLLATRGDFESLAPAVVQVGKNIAASTEASVSQATAAASAIASLSQFSGDTGSLQRMTAEIVSLSRTMGNDIPAATAKFVSAMKDPATAAGEWAKTHSYGFNDEIAKQVKLMQEGGDAAGAFALVEKTLATETAKSAANVSIIEEAWKKLGQQFVHTGADGSSLATEINDLVANTLEEMKKILALLQQLGDFFNSLPGWVVKLATSPTAPWSSTGLTQNPALGGAAPSIQGALAQSSAVNNLDPELLKRLQMSEGLQNPDGTWKTSSSGARGPMQVLPSTFAGIQSGDFPTAQGLTDIDNPGQNVAAGAALFARLLRKYKDPGLAIFAYHDGETTLDRIISSGSGSPSQAAQDQASKVLSGYSGTGFANNQLVINAGKAPGTDNKNSIEQITKQAEASGVLLAKQKELAIQETELIAKQAELDNSGMHNSDAYKMVTQQLHAVWGQMNDNISAGDKLVRTQQEDAEASNQDGEAKQKIAAGFLALQRAADASGDSTQLASQKAALQTGILLELGKARGISLLAVTREIEATNALADAQGQGQEVIEHVTNVTRGHIEALKSDSQGMEENNATARLWTEALDLAAEAKRNLSAKSDIASFAKENEMIQLQTSLLGKQTAVVNEEVAALQERQKLGLVAGQQANSLQQQSIDAARYTANLKSTFSQQQQDLNELANAFSSAFDTISAAMVNSFLSGSGAAVNWGNVMKSVVQQVIAEFLKLAILNPLLNGLFGGSRSELGGVIGALGGASGSTSGNGGGVVSFGGNLLTGAGVANQLGLFDSIGLTGPNGVFSGLKSMFTGDGFFGSTGTIANFLNSGIGGTSVFEATAAGNAALTSEAFLPGGALSTSTSFGAAPTGILGGASIGSLASGVAAGFGIGSLAGGLVANLAGKAQGPNPMIGAGVGALSGAAIGSIVPGIGTIVGGIIGGILGGTGGGLFGPKPQSSFSGTPVSVDASGNVVLGKTVAQKYDNAKADRENQDQFVTALNAVTQQLGVLIHLGGLNEVGTNHGVNEAPRKQLSLQDAFSQFRFSSKDEDLNALIAERSFATIDNMAKVVGSFKGFIDTVRPVAGSAETQRLLARGSAGFSDDQLPERLQNVANYVANIIPALLSQGKATGSLNEAIDALHVSFDPAISMAHELAYKENELIAAREKGIASVIESSHIQRDQWSNALQARGAVARGNAQGVLQEIALTQFDTNAAAERVSYGNQLAALFGESVRSTQGYADQIALLEKTLGEERVALVRQSNDTILSHTRQFNEANENFIIRARTSGLAIGGPQGAGEVALAAKDFSALKEHQDFRKSLLDAFGPAFELTQDYTNRMVQLETALAYERWKIMRDNNEALYQLEIQRSQLTQNLVVRRYNAEASLSGRAADAQKAELYAQEVTAIAARQQLRTQLIGLYGDIYTGTADYAAKMVYLEKTLGIERLAIQKKYNDQISGTAAQLIQSIADYAHGLEVGNASPLSPNAQYDLASSQFNAVSGAAVAGDLPSLQKLTQYSDTLLNASRAVNGSGQGYADDFKRVIDVLNQVASIPAQTLTAAIYTAEIRSQTEVLVNAQATATALLRSILTELQQNGNRPARAA